ncbi:MAG: acetate--CoA ligase family protein [Candidatus Pacearchaeota archaeon]|jgi:acetyltransferase
MKFFSEKRAEHFLEKNGFVIVDSYYVRSKRNVKRALKVIGFPCVMKVAGRKIVHKANLGGVKINIKTYSQALSEFSILKSIKDSEGVIFQKIAKGNEFILGIKKATEFGHVIVFGVGGSGVEFKKDFAFRICPVSNKEILEMIRETKIGKKLSEKNIKSLKENISKLNYLVEKYPEISELDINPFFLDKGIGKVVDARIVWE